MSKSHQAGSATTFVIIAVILVAATIGGIYFVVQRGDQARKDQAASRLAEQQAAQKAVDAKNAQAAAAAAAANKAAATKSSSSTVATSTAQNATDLPTTGPELNIVRFLAIGLLVGTLTSFVLSRRGLKRPL
ncbi:hypothetical protein EPN95_01710 [Patescibacteria group bacterium]|nr:MAG: hypothetical protein EPN95_01710 [Patescibacteria group bacterium]